MTQVISGKENSENEINVSSEFIEESKVSKKKRKSGPYSKDERIKRQNEVYRLHFDSNGNLKRSCKHMLKAQSNKFRKKIYAHIDFHPVFYSPPVE